MLCCPDRVGERQIYQVNAYLAIFCRIGFHKDYIANTVNVLFLKSQKLFFAWMVNSQFSITNKLELWRKRCQITASSWRLFVVSVQSKEVFRSFLFLIYFFCCCWNFSEPTSGFWCFLGILQCSAVWVGGSQSSALWANVHITKTTLWPCTLEIRSSAKLKSVQKTAVIGKINPLHWELGFGLSTLLSSLIFGGPS